MYGYTEKKICQGYLTECQNSLLVKTHVTMSAIKIYEIIFRRFQKKIEITSITLSYYTLQWDRKGRRRDLNINSRESLCRLSTLCKYILQHKGTLSLCECITIARRTWDGTTYLSLAKQPNMWFVITELFGQWENLWHVCLLNLGHVDHVWVPSTMRTIMKKKKKKNWFRVSNGRLIRL